MLGQPVTQEFMNAGFEVSILARNTEKAKKIFGSSIEVIDGNVKDIDKIRQLLKGQDGIYLNLSVEQKSSKTDFQPEREGLDNILKVAKEANIKRVGYLWKVLTREHIDKAIALPLQVFQSIRCF